MNKVIIAAVGDQPEAIFPALREFTVEHVHLLTHPAYREQARQLRTDLDKFGVRYTEDSISDNIWEDVFVKVGEFAQTHHKPEQIVVHAGVGDRVMQCATTNAAFVNGLKAVNGNKDVLFGLPIMRFSYYNALNDRKRKIMGALEGGSRSMSDVSEELGVSLSLLSYHVHGNRKSEGLVDMGVVELSEKDNQTYLSLSAMGRLLLKGHVPEASA